MVRRLFRRGLARGVLKPAQEPSGHQVEGRADAGLWLMLFVERDAQNCIKGPLCLKCSACKTTALVFAVTTVLILPSAS